MRFSFLRRWNAHDVVFGILKLHEIGVDISYVGMLEYNPHLLYAAVHYFRNWGQAITFAGLDYDKIRRQECWSRNRIKGELKKLKRKREDLSYNSVEKKYPKLIHAAIYQFDNWESAVGSIGIDYEKVRKLKRWTKDMVIERIKKLREKGKDLSYSSLRGDSEGNLISAGCFYFNNWGRALKAAGLNERKIRKREIWNKKKIMNRVKRLDKKGVALNWKNISRLDMALLQAGVFHLGSWKETIESCGFEYDKIRKK